MLCNFSEMCYTVKKLIIGGIEHERTKIENC